MVFHVAGTASTHSECPTGVYAMSMCMMLVSVFSCAVVLPQWANGVVRVTATPTTSQHNTGKHTHRVCSTCQFVQLSPSTIVTIVFYITNL